MVIYKIENKLDGKIYIGSTTNFKRRKYQHTTDLNCNRHPNPKLQNAYNKYGKNNFEIVIIETVSSEESLIPREQFYLDTLKPFYNIRKIAESNRGSIYVTKTPNKTRKRKAVVQYTKDLVPLNEWKSISEVAQTLNIPFSNISNCCNGHIKSCVGFIFKFKDNFIPYIQKGLTRSESAKLNGQKSAKTYKITYKNGKVKTFTNFSQYCRDNSLNRGCFKNLTGKNTMDRLGFNLEKA